MNNPINKSILLLLCFALYSGQINEAYAVVPVIAAVTASALSEYLQQDWLQRSWPKQDWPKQNWLKQNWPKAAVITVFSLLCLVYPPITFFLPVICYDAWSVKPKWAAIAVVLPVIANVGYPGPVSYLMIIVQMILACLMRYQSEGLEKQKKENKALRDSAKELSDGLLQKNKELLEKQDYETNLAMLRERNRISREIHDTVGHLLSSSILQVGALLAICKDDLQREGLMQLHKTLSEGMNNVRSAVHNLHDESVDLYTEIKSLSEAFCFCPVTFEYDVAESPEKQVKYAFVAIVKEALSNVAKHSNATRVNIAVHEHPAIYQLVVSDNGTPNKRGIANNIWAGQGLGLKNIRDRVEALGGFMNINTEKGFELFVSVRKANEA